MIGAPHTGGSITPMATEIEYNPFAPATIEDPYPLYARMRKEDPIHYSENLKFWTLTRYDDVVAVARNYEEFSSATGFPIRRGEDGQPTFSTMINSDPPKHGQLRGIVARTFTPRTVAALEPRIRAIANELLDEVQAEGRFDVIQDFAIPLPVTVIAEVLGVPTEMRKTFKQWSDDLVLSASGMQGAQGSIRNFYDYFRGVCEDRRQSPRDDVITDLVRAEANDRLNAWEVLDFCLLLLVAGNETTTNLIGNGISHIARNRDQYELVRRDPALVPNWVEESLRYEGPVQGLFRGARRDIELGGKTVREGQMLMVMYAAAGRDPEHFADADRFDIMRDPNDHVAFGTGIHFCLGAPLARLEARIAFETVLERLPNMQLQPGDHRVPSFLVRGYDHLPMSFDAN